MFKNMRTKGLKKMNITLENIDLLTPYTNNPRNNETAIKYVAESIKQFGFKVPIIIDGEGVVIAGHTRLAAAKQLGFKKIPCIVADDLTPDQIKAFRLADNKVAEFAQWDFQKLNLELDELDYDMGDFGFLDNTSIDWDTIEDLSEETYSEPKKDKLQCPECAHQALKSQFVVVKG